MSTAWFVQFGVIILLFTFFSVVLGWASRNAPPTFPGEKPYQGPARAERNGTAAARAH
ncbi:MAG: hypothetical protein IT534_05940 [Bauldia sp.]|nr:hypothetical protein [Bauldia sp.]